MPDATYQERRPAAWSFVLAGWIFAIGLGVLLAVIHAQHTQSMKYFVPLLLMAIWLASGTLVAVGTSRVTALYGDPGTLIARWWYCGFFKELKGS